MADEKENKKDQPETKVTFIARPAGRAFGWKGKLYNSDRETGALEVTDPAFADALRSDIKRGVGGLEEVDNDRVGQIRSQRREAPQGGERIVGAPRENR